MQHSSRAFLPVRSPRKRRAAAIDEMSTSPTSIAIDPPCGHSLYKHEPTTTCDHGYHQGQQQNPFTPVSQNLSISHSHDDDCEDVEEAEVDHDDLEHEDDEDDDQDEFEIEPCSSSPPSHLRKRSNRSSMKVVKCEAQNVGNCTSLSSSGKKNKSNKSPVGGAGSSSDMTICDGPSRNSGCTLGNNNNNNNNSRSKCGDKSRNSSSGGSASGSLSTHDLTDLSGTTAARSRKMTDEERKVMLHKRRLRNRASAARSREKRSRTLNELTTEVEDLMKKSARLAQQASQAVEEARKLRAKNFMLMKENELLKAELKL